MSKDTISKQFEVLVEEDTVWLTQQHKYFTNGENNRVCHAVNENTMS